jgi:hypothetical protein
MKNKLFLIGLAVALGLWAAYFEKVGGFRDFVDAYQKQYSQPQSGIPHGPLSLLSGGTK